MARPMAGIATPESFTKSARALAARAVRRPARSPGTRSSGAASHGGGRSTTTMPKASATGMTAAKLGQAFG